MYNGLIKKVQDIKVGDMIMGDDSKERNVITLGRGYDKMYKITSNDGENYIVNSEHILCLKNELGKIIEITVNDYLQLSKIEKEKLLGYRTIINFDDNLETLINPYILGLWLGRNTQDLFKLKIENENYEFILNKLNKLNIRLNYLEKNIYEISSESQDNFRNILNKYDLINNSYLPYNYKCNTRENRFKLIAGIIDTLGYYDENKNIIQIFQQSKELSDDINYLLRSLGFKTKQIKLLNGYTNELYGNFNNIPLQILKINNFKLDDNFNFNLTYNINVEFVKEDNYYGFTIDGNNRFLLGDFTVTHNTTLIKEGIAKAMNKPFIFISLGGATDASFLEGHSYTYEGSIYGRIVNGLITSQCMDPIIYFDELDKISKTHKGDEITNILVHLTDPVQNSHFRDKYFHGIDIDLSRATMIFSFNDPSNINPVLLDRITIVETKFLMISQKIHITMNYLLPEILKEMGLNQNDIILDENTIRYLINCYTHEGGVRKLKSLLYNICRELNLGNLTKQTLDDDNKKIKIKFPFFVKNTHIKLLLKHKIEIEPDKIHHSDKPGVVNGLWANSYGNGGLLQIETMLIPSNSFLSVKATGHLEKVIKESTEVATSLAWNYLSDDVKNKYLFDAKDKPFGIHIHCPDGATPKDGPSAGAALTLAIYSLLTGYKIKHDIAMTGEINLEGQITAIGGLEEKLEGAKRAGIRLVLYPKENEKHFNKIILRNNTLIDNSFNVQSIETFNDVINYALIKDFI